MKKKLLKIITWFLVTRTKWRANRLHFAKAIRTAEELAAGTRNRKGKRTYIYFLGGKYRVVNRKQVQWLKNQGTIKNTMNLEKMKGIQLYDTQGHENSHPIYKNVEVKGIDITYRRTACVSNK
jgi:hypothetical protein